MPERITANLPARDFDETARFYAPLGFDVGFRDASWMILARNSLEMEFFPHPDLVPEESWFSACVRIHDLDALYAQWRPVVGAEQGIPRTTPPAPIGHDLRMFALIDCNGSLLRCLSSI